jgi:hypothetical protein
VDVPVKIAERLIEIELLIVVMNAEKENAINVVTTAINNTKHVINVGIGND